MEKDIWAFVENMRKLEYSKRDIQQNREIVLRYTIYWIQSQ